MTHASKPSRECKPKGPFCEELIDQLLSQVQGQDAQSLLGNSGDSGAVEEAARRRMLSAELSHHLDSESAAAGQSRNGTSRGPKVESRTRGISKGSSPSGVSDGLGRG